jgi:hypothetical protein
MRVPPCILQSRQSGLRFGVLTGMTSSVQFGFQKAIAMSVVTKMQLLVTQAQVNIRSRLDMRSRGSHTEDIFMRKFVRFASVWLSLLIAPGQPGRLQAQAIPVPAPKMNVVVVEGEAAIHNLREKKVSEVVVLVRDGNRNPIPKASVTFTLPAEGPSGTFSNGTTTVNTTTNNDGYAFARGIRPNSLTGPFRIQVEAQRHEEKATATITQFNMSVDSSSKGGSGKWIVVFSAVGAAAAGGAVFALRNGSSSVQPTAPPAPIGIAPGAGTVGPPR